MDDYPLDLIDIDDSPDPKAPATEEEDDFARGIRQGLERIGLRPTVAPATEEEDDFARGIRAGLDRYYRR